MITMVTEGRQPLLATLSGTSAMPNLRLTALSERVAMCWKVYIPKTKSCAVVFVSKKIYYLCKRNNMLTYALAIISYHHE